MIVIAAGLLTMDFTPHAIAGLLFVVGIILAYSLRVRRGRVEKILQDNMAPLRTKPARNEPNQPDQPDQPDQRDYDRYRRWRGDRHHAIGSKTKGNSHPDATSATTCTKCNDTGSIIRGYDGRKISCPDCRRFSIPQNRT